MTTLPIEDQAVAQVYDYEIEALMDSEAKCSDHRCNEPAVCRLSHPGCVRIGLLCAVHRDGTARWLDELILHGLTVTHTQCVTDADPTDFTIHHI